MLDHLSEGKLHYSMLAVGGAISVVITAWGCISSLMLDYQKPTEMALMLCFVLPLPCFLLSFKSVSWSAVCLWILFGGQWALRALTLGSNSQLNPIDALGTLYFSVAISVQLALIFGSREKS